MDFLQENIGKIKTAHAILLVSCLLPFLPYSYFTMVRLVSIALFAIYIKLANDNKDDTAQMIFFFLILIFQPFFKIALGRFLWNVLDVGVAGYLLFFTKKS